MRIFRSFIEEDLRIFFLINFHPKGEPEAFISPQIDQRGQNLFLTFPSPLAVLYSVLPT